MMQTEIGSCWAGKRNEYLLARKKRNSDYTRLAFNSVSHRRDNFVSLDLPAGQPEHPEQPPHVPCFIACGLFIVLNTVYAAVKRRMR
jgi:hypothetical protein